MRKKPTMKPQPTRTLRRDKPAPQAPGVDTFEEMVNTRPEFQPLNATEQPTQQELNAFNTVADDMLEFVYGPKSDDIIKMVSNSPQLYQGVGNAAFQILLAMKQKHEKGGEPLPPAALWGEGGLIHTTVDEVYQLVQAAGVKGSDDPDQYAASMFEIYRLAGEYIQNTQEDNSIMQAQELIIDIEEAGGGRVPSDVFAQDHERLLQSAIQNSMAARTGQQQPLNPEEVPPQGGPQQGPPMGGGMPQQGGQPQPQQPQQGGGILGGGNFA